MTPELERLLVEAGLLTEGQLNQCKAEAAARKVPISQILLAKRWLPESIFIGMRAVALFRDAGTCFGVPSRIAHFRILERLAEGATSFVFRALDLRVHREVALKVLKAGPSLSEEAATRFTREAQVMAKIQHPGIVRVYEVGVSGGLRYMSLELIQGPTLQHLFQRRLVGPRRLARLLASVARTIQFAHDHGIIHRDLKPSNILLGTDGAPRIVDFGLADIRDSRRRLESGEEVLGTVYYMSPEHVRGKNIDARSDVYSLGATLYEGLTGRPPFDGSVAHEIFEKILLLEPAVPRSAPTELAAIALKALAKDPSQRYPSALHFAEDLENFLNQTQMQRTSCIPGS